MRLMIAVAVTLLTAGAASAACLPYDTPVSLTGKLTTSKFFTKGMSTEWESARLLVLKAPICTVANANNDAAKAVKRVQVNGACVDGKNDGATITVSGTLAAEMTVHDHTPVVLACQ